ncbi:MAG: hypothetical protein AB7N91_05380 [Candidatus Tectimicrobiota bacterium]
MGFPQAAARLHHGHQTDGRRPTQGLPKRPSTAHERSAFLLFWQLSPAVPRASGAGQQKKQTALARQPWKIRRVMAGYGTLHSP